MKRNAFLALLLALTLAMLLPVAGSVNISSSDYRPIASGSPGPPPMPNVVNEPVLVASGSPGPPPMPDVVYEPVLVASGSPGPPPMPNVVNEPVLVASGSPGPPPMPDIFNEPVLIAAAHRGLRPVQHHVQRLIAAGPNRNMQVS
jgi:hypothetical protein